MPLIVSGVALAAKLGTDIYRGVQANKERKKAQSQLDKLAKTPIPQYSVSPEVQSYYSQAASEAANPQGFSGAETAAFNQNVARNTNTQYANAVNRAGGQASQYIANLLNMNNLNAYNQFAAQGEGIRRGNRQAAFGRQAQGMSQIQNVNNMNTQSQLQRRLMVEQALGGTIAQQKQNIDNMWKGIGDTAGNVGGFALGGGFGAKNAQPTVPTGFNTTQNFSGMNQANYGFNGTGFNPNFRAKVDMFGNPIYTY